MSGDVVHIRRHEFERGDCVRLKSGGPLMLIGVCDSEIWSDVMCVWVIERGRLAHDILDARTLTLIARCAP